MAAAMATGLVLLPAPNASSANIGNLDHGCPLPSDLAGAVNALPDIGAVDAQIHLSTTLGARGEVTGRVLYLRSSTGPRTIALGAESFVSPVVSNLVIFGEAGREGSEVGAIDLATGCRLVLYRATDVVRSAVLDADLRSLYVHSVGLADRADLGVWRVDLKSGAESAVLPAVTTAEPFGPTFATTLRWSIDGDALAVQSCGIDLCRTRIYSPGSGGVESYSNPPHGHLVGLNRTILVTFGTCPGLPCSLRAIDRHSGRVTTLDIPAVDASLGQDAAGLVISATTPAGKREIRP